MAKVKQHNELIERKVLSKIQYCDHGKACKICCHIYQGGKHRQGYGHIYLERKNGKEIHTLAHVAVYEYFYGVIENRIKRKIKVLHTCDNTSCVNYNHLYAGTQYDNIQDRVKRNRSAVAERSGKHKLTREQVRYIRSHYIYRSREYGSVALASMFDVSYQTILSIVHNKHRIQG